MWSQVELPFDDLAIRKTFGRLRSRHLRAMIFTLLISPSTTSDLVPNDLCFIAKTLLHSANCDFMALPLWDVDIRFRGGALRSIVLQRRGSDSEAQRELLKYKHHPTT